MIPFEPFPKIARLTTPMTITEKLDGTNASVSIVDLNEVGYGAERINTISQSVALVERFAVLAGSRKRWITPEDDNFGFARWVKENAAELVDALGPGRHFGEWWGRGIQRGYDGEPKRFSLFNTHRFANLEAHELGPCHVVPVLTQYDTIATDLIHEVADHLRNNGSVAAPGYMRPEGLMIYLHGPRTYIKYPFDPAPKGQ